MPGDTMKRRILSVPLLSVFFLFLFYREAVMSGASEGLVLWYRYVLPTLLPFMILTQLMMQTDTVYLVSRITETFMRYFPGVSGYGCFAVIAGFLCGYPMGAKITADLTASRRICPKEGAFLLSFCNNMSPMFILGVLFHNYIPEPALHLPFFLILTGSPLLCSQMFRIYYTRQTERNSSLSHGNAGIIKEHSAASIGTVLNNSITESADAIIRVALYMMLASIWMHILDQIILTDSIGKSIVLSSFEITTGLDMLSVLTVPRSIRYILMLALTSFGGISSILQTLSMIQQSELKIIPYILEKLVTMVVTSLLAYLYLMSNY